MKKILSFMIAAMMAFTCLGGAALAEDKIDVVVTIFPVYDWVREIVADDASHVELDLLLDSGVDLHSYQPTASDILKISTADVFIYVGGESDEWVEDVLKSAMNPHLTAIDLLEALGDDVKPEEIVEGMEHEHDHEHEHEESGEDHDHESEEHSDEHEHEHEGEEHADHDHEGELDEHVWLSLRNAQKLVTCIADTMAGLDADHTEHYQANAAAYIAKLAALDVQYQAAVDAAACKTVLFGDRFPFRYLADDYGLDYYAAFSGCSAETEASFNTIIFLAQKVDELGLPAVLTIENTKSRIAETIVQTTKAKDQKILVMDSMQGTTAADVAAGVTYLTVMEKNLTILQEALD